MAVYEIFAHPELRRYKSTIVSKASLFLFGCFLITFIIPILITYRSGGFWIKESTYLETPIISFKHDFLLDLELDGGAGSLVTYSTFQKYNTMQGANLRVPVVTSREVDNNGDGRADQLTFNVEMPLRDSEHVRGVRLVLFFYYKLVKYSSFHMESLAVITETAPLPAEKMYIFGDLVIKQKQALAHRGIDTRFNTSLIDSSSSFAEEYNLLRLLETYSKRNVSTRLASPDVVWTSNRAPGSPFVLKAQITYPNDESYRFRPGFWYMIKWAWVQYISVLIIFVFIFERIKVFFFMNQMVTTIVEKAGDVKNRRFT